MSVPEYQQWHVTQLAALGIPIEFAQSFVAFTRDVANNDQTLTDTDERSINNSSRLDAVEATLDSHVGASSAHNASGDIVGTGNAPSLAERGAVLLASSVTDASNSTVSVTSPNVGSAPATYSQAHAQSNATLTNELKGDVNQLVTDLNNAIGQLNELMDNLRASGVLNN